MKTWFVRPVLALCLLALLVTVSAAADNKKAPDKKKDTKDPPGTETLMASLRAWFKTHANKDNEMTKLEAAKAFGYSREYDAPPLVTAPGTKPAEKPKDDKPKDDSEKPSTGSSGGTGDGDQGKPALSYKNRPDYLFMMALDKNNDGKVTQDEFDTWAHDYAKKQMEIQEAELKALEAQKKKQANEAKKHQAQARALRNALRGFEHLLHK